MNPLTILLVIAAGLLLGAGFVGGIVWFALRWASRGSGWAQLASRYPGDPGAGGEVATVMKVGSVMYRRCVRVGLSSAGLALESRLPGHAPVLIPWSDVRGLGKAWLQWQSMVAVELAQPDEPRLVLPEPLRPQIEALRRTAAPVEAELASTA